MRYKLVASDIDGTLLQSDFQISEYTKKTIQAAINKGIHFVLASGRIFGSARVYARQLGLNTAILACNGAIAKNALDGKVIFADPLAKETCQELFAQFEKDGTYYQFYGEEAFYAPRMVKEAMYFKEWALTLPEKDRIPVVYAPDPYAVLEKEAVYKIFIKSEGEKTRDYHRALIGSRQDVTLTCSWDTNFEINGAGVTKGNSVLKYGKMLGIKPEEIICIGDNHNDMDMIKAAGLGVAMGNGEEEVKAMAGYVTDTNDNDGVAKVLEKFIL